MFHCRQDARMLTGPEYPCRSIPPGIPDDAKERLDAVFPGDVLTFLVVASVVADRDRVDPALARGTPLHGGHVNPRRLGGDLRLEPKPIAFQLDPLNRLPPKDLVADLHVGQ